MSTHENERTPFQNDDESIRQAPSRLLMTNSLFEPKSIKSMRTMKTNIATRLAKGCLLAAIAIASTHPLPAVELPVFGSHAPQVDIHGFASQGFIWNSGHNDYLGGNSSEGSLDFREYGINASWAKGKWRIGAQAFGQKLGPYGGDEMTLDWGGVDYQAAQWFGLRGGRVKMPRGLYNEALDLDFTRPFVLLPQSIYDARLRDFQASFDGGMAYGNVSLAKAGSLDYKVFFGYKSMSTNSGANDYFNNDAPFPNTDISMDDAWGGTVFWNTPLQGLRIGYSFSRFDNFSTIRIVPGKGPANKNTDAYNRHLASIEYTVGNWVFAAEGGLDDADYGVEYTGQPVTIFLHPDCYYYYASATWRPKSWLELGAYYSSYHFGQSVENTTKGIILPSDQNDFALAARFDLTDYLIFKVEGHYLDGSASVFDVPSMPQPPATRDDSWWMFTAKMTFSF
jgi:hypothetical protein